MGGDAAQSQHCPPVTCERPDIDRGNGLLRPRQIGAFRVFQVDIVEQERVVTAAIEMEEGDTADDLPCPAEREDRLRVRVQTLRKPGGGVDTRDRAGCD